MADDPARYEPVDLDRSGYPPVGGEVNGERVAAQLLTRPHAKLGGADAPAQQDELAEDVVERLVTQ